MRKKLAIAVTAVGALTGIILYGAWISAGNTDSTIYNKNWKADDAYYQEAENLKSVFYENRKEFKQLETYYRGIDDWEFNFIEFSSLKEGKAGAYAYAVYDSRVSLYPYSLIYSYDGEDYDKTELPGDMKQFLRFLADERLARGGSVIVHGERDPYKRQTNMKRFLEVRFYESRYVVSYIYDLSGFASKEQWESIAELENGWYLCSFGMLPEGPGRV